MPVAMCPPRARVVGAGCWECVERRRLYKRRRGAGAGAAASFFLSRSALHRPCGREHVPEPRALPLFGAARTLLRPRRCFGLPLAAAAALPRDATRPCRPAGSSSGGRLARPGVTAPHRWVPGRCGADAGRVGAERLRDWRPVPVHQAAEAGLSHSEREDEGSYARLTRGPVCAMRFPKRGPGSCRFGSGLRAERESGTAGSREQALPSARRCSRVAALAGRQGTLRTSAGWLLGMDLSACRIRTAEVLKGLEHPSDEERLRPGTAWSGED